MVVAKFDSPLIVEVALNGDVVVKAQGDITLDVGQPDEELEELCIKIFQGDELLAEGHGSLHGAQHGHGAAIKIDAATAQNPAKWHVDAKVAGGKAAAARKAIAAASAMTDGPDTAMSAYEWVQQVELAGPGIGQPGPAQPSA